MFEQFSPPCSCTIFVQFRLLCVIIIISGGGVIIQQVTRAGREVGFQGKQLRGSKPSGESFMFPQLFFLIKYLLG